MKPIILVPLIALALAGGSAGAYLALSSEGSVEEATVAQPTATPSPMPAAEAETPTPTPAPTPGSAESPGGAGGGEEGTVVPIAMPLASPQPVPDSWPTYTDPEGRITFRYPADWYDLTDWLGMPSVASWDQQTWQQRGYPTSAIRVDVTVLPIDEGLAERPPEALDVTLDGKAGWQFGYMFDPSLGPAGNHVIVVDHGGYRFMLIGWFADENPDETTFLQIADSFEFSK